jgi:RecA-family ATPase
MLDLKETASPIDKGEIIRPFPILDSMLKPRPWIIKNFAMAGCANALFSDPGKGKSLLELSAGAAVAAGDKYFGPMEIRKNGPVLVVNREESLDEQYHRLWAVMQHRRQASEDIPLHLFGRDDIRLLARSKKTGNFERTKFQDYLVQHIRDEGYVMVVIDPMIELVDNLDENSSVDMNRLVEELASIGRDTGAAMLAVHHSRKGGARGADSLRGSSALRGRFRAMTQLVGIDDNDDVAIPEGANKDMYRTTLNQKQSYGPDGEQWFYKLFLYDHLRTEETNATLMPVKVGREIDPEEIVKFLDGKRYYKRTSKDRTTLSSEDSLVVEFNISAVAAKKHIAGALKEKRLATELQHCPIAKEKQPHFVRPVFDVF